MYADVDVYVANDSKARNRTRINSTMMIMIRDRISANLCFTSISTTAFALM